MPILNQVTAVVFDFDGTLVHQTIDFDRMRADVTTVIHKYGITDPQVLNLYILEMVNAAALRLASHKDAAARLRAEAHAAIEAIEKDAAQHARPIPGARKTLQQLRHQGIRLGIVTRNSRPAMLTAFSDIERMCDVVLPREAVRNVKPHPEHLSTCLTRLGVAPEHTLMVGDHPLDVEAGQRQNMATVGVLTGNGTEATLRQAGADFVLRDVNEVMGLLS